MTSGLSSGLCRSESASECRRLMRLLAQDTILRANPGYEVVLLDRLEPSQRQELQDSFDSGDLYGALVPRGRPGLAYRSVSFEIALLFFALATPGTLPRYALQRLGEDAERTIRRLVIDEVLQVLYTGEFVSGHRVAELLPTRRYDDGEERCRNLSVAALRYAQELTGLREAELALRLYSYGRQPLSPQLSRSLASPLAVATYLGIAQDGPVSRALGHRWFAVPMRDDVRAHWWQWKPRSTAVASATISDTSYKLYISPAIHDVRAALETVAGVLSTTQGVTGFKIGAGLPGMCRPDKMLVYSSHLDDLLKLAGKLDTSLGECPAHGVPFTASVRSDGLLSWGADPPAEHHGRRGSSWRSWLVVQLAEHLASAKGARLTILEPWQFALERLQLAGIDTVAWVPPTGAWPESLGGE